MAGAVGGKEKPAENEKQTEKGETSDKKEEKLNSDEDEAASWFTSWGIPSGITKVVESTTKAVENTVSTRETSLHVRSWIWIL